MLSNERPASCHPSAAPGPVDLPLRRSLKHVRQRVEGRVLDVRLPCACHWRHPRACGRDESGPPATPSCALFLRGPCSLEQDTVGLDDRPRSLREVWCFRIQDGRPGSLENACSRSGTPGAAKLQGGLRRARSRREHDKQDGQSKASYDVAFSCQDAPSAIPNGRTVDRQSEARDRRSLIRVRRETTTPSGVASGLYFRGCLAHTGAAVAAVPRPAPSAR